MTLLSNGVSDIEILALQVPEWAPLQLWPSYLIGQRRDWRQGTLIVQNRRYHNFGKSNIHLPLSVKVMAWHWLYRDDGHRAKSDKV